jgi:hypothetical protein
MHDKKTGFSKLIFFKQTSMKEVKMNGSRKKIVLGCILAVALVFTLTVTNAQAALNTWKGGNVIKVSVNMSSGTPDYSITITNSTGAYEVKLYFTNKELLATALTANTSSSPIKAKFSDVSYELYELEIIQ